MASPITYYLPKKILKVVFPLTITEKKTTYDTGDIVVSPAEAYIKGDFKISSLLIPDESKNPFIYTPKAISFFSKTTLAIEYDSEGAGLLLSFNSQETNKIGEIISATIDVASSLARILPLAEITKLPKEAAPGPAVVSTAYSERQFDIINFIEPELDKEIPVQLPVLPVTLPIVKIHFQKYSTAVYKDHEGKTLTEEEKRLIWYLFPKPVLVKIDIENNSYIEKQTVVEELLYFPQFGDLCSKEIMQKSWWLGSSMNTTLNFSSSTGSLQKFSVTSESNVKELLTDAKKAADARKSYLDDRKKAEANKKKAKGDKKV